MQLHIQRLLRQGEEPLSDSAQYNFQERDFLDFSVPGPVQFSWTAQSLGTAVRLSLYLECEVAAQCVRCLQDFTLPMVIEKSYDISPYDVEGEYPEYPTLPDGSVDLEELAYGELVMEVSPALVCREDCPGLCSVCGRGKDTCQCEEKPPMDPRWQALADLWKEE